MYIQQYGEDYVNNMPEKERIAMYLTAISPMLDGATMFDEPMYTAEQKANIYSRYPEEIRHLYDVGREIGPALRNNLYGNVALGQFSLNVSLTQNKLPSKPKVYSENDALLKSLNGKGAEQHTTKPYDLQTTHGQTLSNRKMYNLVNEIKENGIQETIKYVEVNGTKFVVDGHHRLIAIKKLGINTVPIEQVELPYLGYKTVNDLFWYDY